MIYCMRFLPLLFTVFIDSLGFGLIFPLLSLLIMNPDEGILAKEVSLGMRGWLFGLLISCFCIGQFFGGPVLGALSDRKGRKKVLIATLWVGFFGYLLSIFSIWMSSIVGFLLARLFSGISAGNYSIAQSIVVDCSSEEEKAKNFGLIGMAWGTGFILGPYFGGKLCDPTLFSFCGKTTPFWFAAFLCLANILWLFMALKETLATVKVRPLNLAAGIEDIKRAFRMPLLRGIFSVMFIFSFGWGFFTEFSPLFLIGRFGFGGQEVGNFYAWVGLWIALSQGLLIRPFLKKFSPQGLLAVALVSLGAVLPLMLLIQSTFALFCFLPLLAFFESLIFPTASTLVSNLADKESQGEVLGINNSIQWAAIGISPLFSGTFVALYPHLPITIASIGMGLAWLLFLWTWRPLKA